MNDRYKEYNKYFSLDNHIGTVISEEEFQVLMTAGKIHSTTTWMDRGDAYKAIGGDIISYKEEPRPYAGIIVADSLQEAEDFAIKRGWGETVDGTLEGIIGWNENPTPSKLSNSQFN